MINRDLFRIPEAPDLNLSNLEKTNDLTLMKDQVAVTQYLDILEGTLAEATIQLFKQELEVQKIKNEIQLALYNELESSGTKTNEEMRKCLLAQKLLSSKLYMNQEADRRELEEVVIRLKSLVSTHIKYAALYESLSKMVISARQLQGRMNLTM